MQENPSLYARLGLLVVVVVMVVVGWCVCVFLRPFTVRLHLAGTDQRCCVEDVSFLFQVPSLLL